MRIRLIAALGLASGLLLLTSCSTNPNVAAYVGNTEITEAQVTKLADQFNEKARSLAAEAGQADAFQPVPRQDVLQYMVHEKICDKLKAEKGLNFTPQPGEENDTEIETIVRKVNGCLAALPPEGPDPTEAELKEFFINGQNSGFFPADQTFAQFMQEAGTNEQLLNALKQERVLADAADVRVNPVYGDLNLLILRSGVAEQIGGGNSSVVINRPLPQATPTP